MKSVLVILVSIFGSFANATVLPLCFPKADAIDVMVQTHRAFELAEFKKIYGANTDYAELLERYEAVLEERAEEIKTNTQPTLNRTRNVVGYETVLSAGGQAPRGTSCSDGFIKIACHNSSISMQLPKCWAE